MGLKRGEFSPLFTGLLRSLKTSETGRRDRVHHVHPERGKHKTGRTDRVHYTQRDREGKARDREERQREESMRQRGETEYIMYTQRDRQRKARDREERQSTSCPAYITLCCRSCSWWSLARRCCRFSIRSCISCRSFSIISSRRSNLKSHTHTTMGNGCQTTHSPRSRRLIFTQNLLSGNLLTEVKEAHFHTESTVRQLAHRGQGGPFSHRIYCHFHTESTVRQLTEIKEAQNLLSQPQKSAGMQQDILFGLTSVTHRSETLKVPNTAEAILMFYSCLFL